MKEQNKKAISLFDEGMRDYLVYMLDTHVKNNPEESVISFLEKVENCIKEFGSEYAKCLGEDTDEFETLFPLTTKELSYYFTEKV